MFGHSNEIDPEPIAALSQRISKLERQPTAQPLAIIAELKESIGNHDRQLEILDCRISELDPNITKAQSDLKAPKSPKGDEFPLNDATQLDGIISYLTELRKWS